MIKKADALKALMDVKEEDLAKLDLEQLRTVLGSVRYVTRQLEREVVKREMEQGLFGLKAD